MIPAHESLKGEKPQSLTITYNGKHKQFRGEEFDVNVFGGLEQTAILVAPKPHSKLDGKVPYEIRKELEDNLVRMGYTKNPTYPSLHD